MISEISSKNIKKLASIKIDSIPSITKTITIKNRRLKLTKIWKATKRNLNKANKRKYLLDKRGFKTSLKKNNHFIVLYVSSKPINNGVKTGVINREMEELLSTLTEEQKRSIELGSFINEMGIALVKVSQAQHRLISNFNTIDSILSDVFGNINAVKQEQKILKRKYSDKESLDIIDVFKRQEFDTDFKEFKSAINNILTEMKTDLNKI